MISSLSLSVIDICDGLMIVCKSRSKFVPSCNSDVYPRAIAVSSETVRYSSRSILS